jgi:hypothetical protein
VRLPPELRVREALRAQAHTAATCGRGDAHRAWWGGSDRFLPGHTYAGRDDSTVVPPLGVSDNAVSLTAPHEKGVWDQKVVTFLRLHEKAFRGLGGVVRLIRHDNLKAAVVRASFATPVRPQRIFRRFRRDT